MLKMCSTHCLQHASHTWCVRSIRTVSPLNDPSMIPDNQTPTAPVRVNPSCGRSFHRARDAWRQLVEPVRTPVAEETERSLKTKEKDHLSRWFLFLGSLHSC